MSPEFKAIDPYNLTENAIRLIGKEWMLVTAGAPGNFNTMTASWGCLGELWHKPVSFCFVRPQRYTYEFMEKNDVYTLSFFGSEHRNVLNICGTKSGRDIDKMGGIGLTPIEIGQNGISFAEARLVISCKKLYVHDLLEDNFLVSEIVAKEYPGKDFHRMYVGAITTCLIRE